MPCADALSDLQRSRSYHTQHSCSLRVWWCKKDGCDGGRVEDEVLYIWLA